MPQGDGSGPEGGNHGQHLLNQTTTLRISAPVIPLKIKKYGLALRLPAYQTFLPEPVYARDVWPGDRDN